jgi:hypothetical protein
MWKLWVVKKSFTKARETLLSGRLKTTYLNYLFFCPVFSKQFSLI